MSSVRCICRLLYHSKRQSSSYCIVCGKSRPLAFSSCVRGYHVYEDQWIPVTNEELACRRQPRNVHDPYAVAVSILGYLSGRSRIYIIYRDFLVVLPFFPST